MSSRWWVVKIKALKNELEDFEMMSLWKKCLFGVLSIAFFVEWYSVNLKWALIGLGIWSVVIVVKMGMPTSIQLGSTAKKIKMQLTYFIVLLAVAVVCWRLFDLVYIPITIALGAFYPKNSDNMIW